MSAQFIVEYAGWPMDTSTLKLVTADRATVFVSEADAWLAAQRTGLAAHAFKVISKYAADQQARPTTAQWDATTQLKS